MIPLMITEWVGPRLFKLAGAGVVAAFGVTACMVRDGRLTETGRQEVVQASKAAGAEANEKSDKVRRDVARVPGAADRLRKDRATCRDC